jgi:hypothetical protein
MAVSEHTERVLRRSALTRGWKPRQQIFMLNLTGTKATSDNFDGSSTCAGVYGYAGFCFLPYSN